MNCLGFPVTFAFVVLILGGFAPVSAQGDGNLARADTIMATTVADATKVEEEDPRAAFREKNAWTLNKNGNPLGWSLKVPLEEQTTAEEFKPFIEEVVEASTEKEKEDAGENLVTKIGGNYYSTGGMYLPDFCCSKSFCLCSGGTYCSDGLCVFPPNPIIVAFDDFEEYESSKLE